MPPKLEKLFAYIDLILILLSFILAFSFEANLITPLLPIIFILLTLIYIIIRHKL